MISAPEGAFLERLFISGESVIFFTSLRGTEFRDFTARFPVIFNNGDTAMRWLLRMQPVQPVPPVKREQLSGYLFTLKKITGDQGTIFDISGEYLQSANSKPLPLTVAVGKKGVPCPEGIYTVATSAFKDKFTAEIVVELPTHSLQLCADFSFSLPPGTPDMRSGNIALLGDPSTKATVNLFQVEEEKP
jgi:hypothetical protein